MVGLQEIKANIVLEVWMEEMKKLYEMKLENLIKKLIRMSFQKCVKNVLKPIT